MKTIEQLLQLSKNPFYKFTPAEEQVLNDFLSKKQEEATKRQAKKSSENSEKSTPATATKKRVRNVVKKTIPSIEESGE